MVGIPVEDPRGIHKSSKIPLLLRSAAVTPIFTMRTPSYSAVFPIPSPAIFALVIVLVLFPACAQGISSFYESDRIASLPGQPTAPAISQFSGYVTVDEIHGRALFYWLLEAQDRPETKPLLLWLNGGPGCSSIGYGAAAELGPLKVKTNGTGLEYNRFGWNRDANVLFLESPIGVGFSYTNTSSDYTKLNDTFVAEDAHSFVVNWLKRFPHYQSHELYLSGESYAGHYVPQLAELIYDRNSNGSYGNMTINLKGYMVGNPLTEDYLDTKGLVEYAWSHTVIDDALYKAVVNACDFRLNVWTEQCVTLMRQVFAQYKEIDIYNVYAPKCFKNSNASAAPSEYEYSRGLAYSKVMALLRRNPDSAPTAGDGGYDPCYSNYAERYFNRDDVKAAFHAKAAADWKVCNDSTLHVYNFTVVSVLPIYTKLIKAGLRIWLYSGDADGRVPVIGSRYCVEALGLPLKNPWRTWYHKGQVAGRFVEYQGITMATVRGAGHLVPLNKPREALRLINTYLAGQSLPINR